MKYVQEPPFCIQVEFSEGCNLQCSFCGINGIREKPGNFKLMTQRTADIVARGIANAKWTSRIEFAMHGEPTMNPEFVELVQIFRERLPRNQLMMTSNGAGLLKNTTGKVQALFDAGLNILALDDYENVKIVPKIVAALEGYAIELVRYPQDGLEYSPHRRQPRGTKRIVVIEDITKASSGSHATITNHAGCGGPPSEERQDQRCAKPFREIGVRWNGDIAGCCNDWRGIYKVGNATITSIGELWQSQAFNAMRIKLYAGQRDFGACDGCDYRSYRNGLLPDKKGALKMPRVTPQINELVHQFSAGKPLTKPVKRPWEVKK